MKSFVYILEIDNGQYYIGSTTCLSRRIKEHKLASHAGTRYTKQIRLIFYQEFENNLVARKIELKLKKFKSKKIIEKIVSEGSIKIK